jgi:hypothetical protein
MCNIRVAVVAIFLTLLFFVPDASAANGEVRWHQKISSTEGGFTGTLDNHDDFGCSAASLGDLDGDGVTDLAVGAKWDGDGGAYTGAVWILFLNSDGTVKAHQKISDTEGGFTGTLDNGDHFGNRAASLGDLDGDGVTDLAVGATGDDDGGTYPRGAVWVLFLNSDGTVKAHQKISDTEGGFTGTLDYDDRFGFSAASLGDLDGDGVTDLAVGAHGDDDGGGNRGAVWVLFLDGVAGTISVDLTCAPSTGTLPYISWMTLTLTNLYADQFRQFAGHIDVTLAGGAYFSNWRVGHLNVLAGESYVTEWDQHMPAFGSIVGENQFVVFMEDVTPAPYNQPPYPPAGDIDTASCTVTGIAP